MLNGISFIVRQDLWPKFINRFIHKQNFNSFLLKSLQLRIIAQYGNIIAGNIINSFLLFITTRYIFI